MAKYNITEKKEKVAAYRGLVSPKMMDEMQEKIMNIIVMQKRYRDKDYSAKKLAEDLGTNTRYISAVVNVRFHMNYTSFVNKYRIDEAMSILVDKRYQSLRMEEVSDMVGFSNRQSFYASTRSAFIAERQRANTASPMSVSGTPSSSAAMPVHLPVPFWPAVSRMFSTSAEPSLSL